MTEVHPPPTPRQHLWLVFWVLFFFFFIKTTWVQEIGSYIIYIYIRIFHIAISFTRGYLHLFLKMDIWLIWKYIPRYFVVNKDTKTINILSGYHNSAPRPFQTTNHEQNTRWSAFSNYLFKVRLKIKCYTSKILRTNKC